MTFNKILIKFFWIFLLFFSSNIFAQGTSNKGTDFWLGYGTHISHNTNNPEDMVLYITSDVNTTATVEVLGLAFTQTVNITANTVQQVTIPLAAHLGVEGKSNLGIHVTSLKPVIVYSHIYNGSISGATLVLPTNTLGKEYYSINYKQISNSANSASFFFVVAVEDNTQVEIIPSANTQGGWLANSVNTVTLKKGEIYHVMGTFTNITGGSTGVDLTGSKIRSISSAGTCKKIAVFSGSSKISISCLNTLTNGSADNLFQQVYPTATWGKKFITVPLKDRNFDVIRILKSDPLAVVTVNGLIIPGASFVNGLYYDFETQIVSNISSDKPIQVVQNAVTQGRGINCTTFVGDVGDPEMIFLNPLEQTLTQITMYSSPFFAILKHFINVVVKNEGVASFKIDGVSRSTSFLPVVGSTTHSYAQISVTAGTHSLSSDAGFNAIAYGFGNAESYGYAAGASLTAFGIETFDDLTNLAVQTGCQNQPLSLNLKLPYKPTEIYLDKGDGAGLVLLPNAPPISETVKDGETTYNYSLIKNLIYNTPSTFPYKVKVIKPTIDDCGTGDEFSFDLIINAKPTANFNTALSTCLNSPSAFTFVADPKEPNISNYLWDFNGEGTSSLKDATFTFTSSGIKKIKFSIKSVSGCWSDVVEKQTEILPLPVAKFEASNPLCVTKVIAFTNQSTTLNGVINKWEWNFDDPTSLTANISTLENPTHTFSVAKTYNVTLTVTTDLGCIKTITQAVTINPLPKTDFESPNICINNPTATFTNKTVVDDGSALTYIWDFGDPVSGANNTSTLKNPTHTYSSPATYSVKLIAKSASGCEFEIIKDIIIYPKPISDFTAPAKSCFNDAITFTDIPETNGPVITDYLWDFNGVGTSTLKNPQFTFTTAGVKSIKYSVKSDKGCWSDIKEKSIEVFLLPVAKFSTSVILCPTSIINFTDNSTTVAQTIVKWEWNFDDPTSAAANTSTLQNPTHNYQTANTYQVSLTVTTDLGCIKTIVQPVIINPLPIPDFETPEICLDDASASFLNKSTIADNSILTYLWNFGDAGSNSNTSTLKNPSHVYSRADNYLVKLITTSSKGCITELIKTFTVNGSTPKSRFTVKNENVLCADQPVVFEEKSTVDFGELAKVEWIYDDSQPTVIVIDNNPNLRSASSKLYSHTYPVFYSPAQKVVNVKMTAYSGNSSNCKSTYSYSITLRAIPIANFSVPNGCLPNGEAQFTNQSTFDGSTTGLTYTWDFGEPSSGLNNTSNLKDPIHQYKNAGNYVVKLTTTAANGCPTTISKTFTVNGAIPISNFKVLNENELCSNNTVVFNDAATLSFGELSKIEWIFDESQPTVIVVDNNPGLRSASAKSYTHSYPVFYSPAQKVVSVKMIAYSGNGTSCVGTYSYSITLKAVPIANFAMPNGCLPNGEAKFTNQSTFDGSTNGLTYVWDFGEPVSDVNNTSNLKDAIHQYKSAGSYVVKLTTTAANGCVNTITKTFVVNGAIPQANFTVLNENDLCSNNTVVFNDVATLAFGEVSKIEWFFDNDNQANNINYKITDNSPTLRSEAAKSYSFTYPIFNAPINKIVNVKMKLYSGNGCESEIIKSIILKAVPNVTFTAIPPICEEVLNYKIVQASETTGFVGLGVFTGNGVSQTGIFTPSIAGVGSHILTYTFTGANGCVDFKTQTITVYPTPKVDAGLDETILIGGGVKLKATASGNNISYKWSPSVGLDNDAVLNPLASPIIDTDYTLTITSENGCEIADQVFIKVLKYPEIPNTFTPNGDGVNDTWEIKYLGSFPNPNIVIFNRNGSIVYQSSVYNAWDGKINGTFLPDGMYYYIITANSNAGPLKYTGSVLIIK